MTVRIPATLALVTLLGIAATGCQQADADPDEFRSITDADVTDADVTEATSPDAADQGTQLALEPDPDSDTLNGEPTVGEPVPETSAGNPDDPTSAATQVPGTSDVDTPTDDANSTPDQVAAVADPDANTATAELVPVEPLEIKLLVPERVFKVEGAEKSLRVSFDDLDLLKVLNMEPVVANAPELMPDWLTELKGKRIRLRGFMYPPYQDADIEAFILARDNQICCFGRDPKVYDLVRILMKDGVTTEYIENRPFDVVGVFHIGDDASIPGKLYTLDDAVVISR